MKGRILLTAALVLVSGCNILEDGFIQGSRRDVRTGGGNNTRPDAPQRDSSDSGVRTDPSKPDTVIYCSAVRCANDYDWQRDTACNTASCEVLLFRNGKEILCIPAGKGFHVSPAPDLHHIIDGHLYTEYCTLEETIICRDGQELLRYKGNEILKGLVYKDNHIHTLARKRDGSGFTYRIDGEIMLAQGDMKVFGGFDNPSYPATGGLYLDGEDIIFCYKGSGSNNACYAVVNGMVKDLNLPRSGILDVKINCGQVLTATTNDLDAKWTEASVITGSTYVLAGTTSVWACAAARGRIIYERLCKGEATVYCSPNRAVAVRCSEGGKVSLNYSTLNERTFDGSWHLFTPACCAVIGDELLVGLSPKERDGRAKLCLGAKTYELEGLGNGFITGVSGAISLPK